VRLLRRCERVVETFLVRVESLLQRDLSLRLFFCFPFSICFLAYVFYFSSAGLVPLFRTTVLQIQNAGALGSQTWTTMRSSRPNIIGIPDPQCFRALRRLKSNNDSADVSGVSSSKLNKAVELLPVVIERKSDRELQACSPVFIHNCLERCIGSYKACSPLNGNL